MKAKSKSASLTNSLRQKLSVENRDSATRQRISSDSSVSHLHF